MGFQDFKPVVHKAASSKGGKVKVPKGLAKLPPEQRKQIAAKGGHAKANRSNTDKQVKENRSGDSQRLADVLGALDEEKL